MEFQITAYLHLISKHLLCEFILIDYNTNMRKLIFIISALFLSSCAEQYKYVVPEHIQERHTEILYSKVISCPALHGAGTYPYVFINPGKEPNAWVDSDDKVHLTEGLYRFDDEVIVFVLAHEISHAKLKHVRNRRVISLVTTGVMIVAGAIVPGLGLLDHVVNPAVTNNYSKLQEYEADKLASEALAKCFDISLDQQIQILQFMQAETRDAGGFWDQHPSWTERIENIKKTP